MAPGSPYRPGAGASPRVLAGREAEIAVADALLAAPNRGTLAFTMPGFRRFVLDRAGES